MTEKQYWQALKGATEKILTSKSRKKLVVAGPGTGKTFLFKEAIKRIGGNKKDFLALTFINNLEDELVKNIGDISKVYTFHGYCYLLLQKYGGLRLGLSKLFIYYPMLIRLVKSDWEHTKKDPPPQFSKIMRNLIPDKSAVDFFIKRSDYYNSVGYDDSVFRVYKGLEGGVTMKEKYKLLVLDEYQDFNSLEAAIIDYLTDTSPSLIAGDDDQALYCILRDSQPDLIRKLYHDEDVETFELPFCLRCPKPVVDGFTDILIEAKSKGLLSSRIDKKFNFFPPEKIKDTKKYPKLKLVTSSIQRSNTLAGNYLGRYIVGEIKKIPKNEIIEANTDGCFVVMVIGPKYYLDSLLPIFEAERIRVDYEAKSEKELDIRDGYKILQNNKTSTLGWRIVVEIRKPSNYSEVVSKIVADRTSILELLPKAYVDEVLSETDKYKEEAAKKEIETDKQGLTVKLTSYEGAKGLSAQHIFILGLQNKYLPRDPSNITDIEVCRLLVALTRTRKQCHMLTVKNFGGIPTTPSIFVSWVNSSRYERINIDKNYWNS